MLEVKELDSPGVKGHPSSLCPVAWAAKSVGASQVSEIASMFPSLMSFPCVLVPLCGCMERRKETKVRREEKKKDVLREMRRPFLGGVT